MYPFADGDLRDSAVCLQNYMENATGKVPWEDLRYVVGQIRESQARPPLPALCSAQANLIPCPPRAQCTAATS